MANTPENTTLDQFIVLANTGVANGQKAKNHSGQMNKKPIMLIARTNFPSDQRRDGSSAPYNRRQMRQPIDTRYELIIATAPEELVECRAVVEPILISESEESTKNETRTARRGMFRPSCT